MPIGMFLKPLTSMDFKAIQIKYKIWLSSTDGKNLMGDGRWMLLKKVEELGSLMAASEAMGISYRKAWGDLKKFQEGIGVILFTKQRGGKDGGQTTLTETGKILLNEYAKMHESINVCIEDEFKKFEIRIKEYLKA